MYDAIHNHIAVLDGKHGTPIPLAQPVNALLAHQRCDTEVPRILDCRYALQTLQEPQSVSLGHPRKLLEHTRGQYQRHLATLFTFSEYSKLTSLSAKLCPPSSRHRHHLPARHVIQVARRNVPLAHLA